MSKHRLGGAADNFLLQWEGAVMDGTIDIPSNLPITREQVRELEARLEEVTKNLAEARKVIVELAELVLDLTGEGWKR